MIHWQPQMKINNSERVLLSINVDHIFSVSFKYQEMKVPDPSHVADLPGPQIKELVSQTYLLCSQISEAISFEGREASRTFWQDNNCHLGHPRLGLTQPIEQSC
jgi:hypothetical protein